MIVDGTATIDRYALTFFSLVVGLEAPKGATRWVERGEAVYLDDPGRKVFIDEFFRRFRTPLLYPRRGVNLPLRAIIREQAYHLARVITGDDPEYEPFGM